MCGALYQCFVQVKKLVLLPLKTGTCVWALVEICKEFAIFMNDKNGLDFTPDFDFETFAAWVFNIGGLAENVCHNVC